MSMQYEGDSIGIPPVIPTPLIPAVLAEWAALVPLATHLASPRDDHITTGEISLRGRVGVPLLPKLGMLSGLNRLLGRGPQYLDFASSRGGASRTVWDVNWGSVFPCANGAASVAVASHVRKQFAGEAKKLFTPPKPEGTANSTTAKPVVQEKPTELPRPPGRAQLLHVYEFAYGKPRVTFRGLIDRFEGSFTGQAFLTACLCGVAILFCLVGAYGTASLVVDVMISRLVAHNTAIRRTKLYLTNNEAHDACMLVAAHENATEWHLYIGDRSVVDTMLNKPMIDMPQGRQAQLAAKWFEVAHFAQLLALTYVAAEKGWDGVCLLLLLLVHYALQRLFRGRALAEQWLLREGVTAKVMTYEFGWRTAMLGSIQIFNRGKVTRWMDTIIVPEKRRDAFLRNIQGQKITEDINNKLEKADMDWIQQATQISVAGAAQLAKDFPLVCNTTARS